MFGLWPPRVTSDLGILFLVQSDFVLEGLGQLVITLASSQGEVEGSGSSYGTNLVRLSCSPVCIVSEWSSE